MSRAVEVAPSQGERGNLAALIVIAIATVLYGGDGLLGPVLETPDSATYWSTAASLRGAPGFAQRPPLFPLLLEVSQGIGSATGLPAGRVAIGLQGLLTALSLALAWALVKRLYGSWRFALLALIVIAADQPLWQFAHLILSESLCIALAIALGLAVVARRTARSAILSMLATLTRAAALGLSLGAGVAILAAGERPRGRAALLRVVLAPIVASAAGIAVWGLYGRLVIPGFTLEPAHAAFGAFASATYCGLDLEPLLPGSGEVLATANAQARERWAGADPEQLRAVGTITWEVYDALARSFDERAILEASRGAILGSPLRYAWCSLRKSVVAIAEGPVSYDFPPRTVDRPSGLSAAVDRLRLALLQLLGSLTAIGFLGLCVATARGRRAARALLVLAVTYLLWIGFAGQGDGELYRIRCPIDPFLLAGLFLPLDDRPN